MPLVRPRVSIAMDRLLTSLREDQLTYTEIGATSAGLEPTGFHHDRYQIALGSGKEAFQCAVNGLRTWKAHDMPGWRVFPQNEEIRTGATVVVTLGTPFLALAAPCRIVSVIDERTRWGFAYGTLPGHPEQGEEAFVVSISPDETVLFDIVAFSRPGSRLVRLSGPVGRVLQKGGTNAYLRTLRRYVRRNSEFGNTEREP